jgi:sRNA-binding protein
MNNFESKASGSLSSTELRTLPRVGQALVEAGAISVHQLREALRQQSMGGQRLLLGEVLLQMELVDRTTLLQAVARTLEIEFGRCGGDEAAARVDAPRASRRAAASRERPAAGGDRRSAERPCS